MKSIAMCSGKGGTGKSCAATYIAEALARAGQKTLLVELGEDSRSLDLILGVTTTAFGVGDVLSGLCEIEEAISSVDRTPGLYLMPPGAETPLNSEDIADLLRKLEKEYDYILVDGARFQTLPVKAFGLFLMVTTPDSLSVRACADLSRRLYGKGAKEIRLIINDVPPRVPPIEGAEDFDGVIDMIGAQLLGVIPQSPKLRYSANSGMPLDDFSLTLKVFEHIAARLMGRRMPLLVR
ncbi:MAG TPA: septum site-determining protein MinD [Clostridiales bacterium]|nr:septum site-determining protein MinD [Clostridiales bacterium]